jgi:hypothetical protein
MAQAQTPDGETPANEGVCDELLYNSTSGLYGLCVAFCEAQDAEATFDPTTGEVTFGEDAKPSNPKLLEIYNRKKTEYDPPMPCVNVEEGGCPCWTEEELDSLSGVESCRENERRRQVQIGNPFTADGAVARIPFNDPDSLICRYRKANPTDPTHMLFRLLEIDEAELAICHNSIRDECNFRLL